MESRSISGSLRNHIRVNVPCNHLLGYAGDMKIHIEDQHISFYNNLSPKPEPLNHSDPSIIQCLVFCIQARHAVRGEVIY